MAKTSLKVIAAIVIAAYLSYIITVGFEILQNLDILSQIVKLLESQRFQ